MLCILPISEPIHLIHKSDNNSTHTHTHTHLRACLILMGVYLKFIQYHTQKWHCQNYAKKVLTGLHGSLQNTLCSDVAAYSTAVGHFLPIMYFCSYTNTTLQCSTCKMCIVFLFLSLSLSHVCLRAPCTQHNHKQEILDMNN